MLWGYNSTAGVLTVMKSSSFESSKNLTATLWSTVIGFFNFDSEGEYADSQNEGTSIITSLQLSTQLHYKQHLSSSWSFLLFSCAYEIHMYGGQGESQCFLVLHSGHTCGSLEGEVLCDLPCVFKDRQLSNKLTHANKHCPHYFCNSSNSAW